MIASRAAQIAMLDKIVFRGLPRDFTTSCTTSLMRRSAAQFVTPAGATASYRTSRPRRPFFPIEPELDGPVFELHSGEAAQPLRVLVEESEQALFHLTIEHRPLDRARERPQQGLANLYLEA